MDSAIIKVLYRDGRSWLLPEMNLALVSDSGGYLQVLCTLSEYSVRRVINPCNWSLVSPLLRRFRGQSNCHFCWSGKLLILGSSYFDTHGYAERNALDVCHVCRPRFYKATNTQTHHNLVLQYPTCPTQLLLFAHASTHSFDLLWQRCGLPSWVCC